VAEPVEEAVGLGSDDGGDDQEPAENTSAGMDLAEDGCNDETEADECNQTAGEDYID